MLHSGALFFLFCSLREMARLLTAPTMRLFGRNSDIQAMKEAHAGLERLRVQLETGISPEASDWIQPFSSLPLWRESIPPLLQRLRSGGLPVLPTLQRLTQLLREETESLRKSKNQSAQSRFQAGVSLFLVPALGFLLAQILEAPSKNLRLWIGVVLGASTLGLVAALWIDGLARKATRHGLSEKDQILPAAAALATEQFLAELRSGLPPDLAWSAMLKTAESWHPEFRALWSPLASTPAIESQSRKPVPKLLKIFAKSVRDAVKSSLYEGRPCGERIETLGDELRKDLEAIRQRELELLPTRALQPLFICVAPAVLGVMGCGLALEASSSFGAWI